MRVFPPVKLALLISFLLATAAALAEITPVQIDGGTPHERTGVLVSQEGQCVVLTAAHEIDQRVSLNVAINGANHPASIFWNGLRLAEPIDVALLRFGQPIDASCDSLASSERINEALRKSEGQLWLPPVGGQVPTPTVRARLRDVKTLTLGSVEFDSPQLTRGISGAPVVFDGLIVGILHGNTDRQFLATRLDHLLRVAGDELKLRRFDLGQPAAQKPYDLDSLPAPVSEKVALARKAREEAEVVSRLALEVETRADEAARLAEEEARNSTGFTSNRSSYSTNGGDHYAGETNNKRSLFSTTITTYPQGYGVLRSMNGNFKDEVNKCIRVGEQGTCKGPMVTLFSPTRSIWRRMEIERRNGVPSGPARVVYRSGVVGYVTMQTTAENDNTSWSFSIDGVGVLEFSDGRRYEGELKNNGANGLGAIWDAQGKLIRAGLWEDGKTVD